MNPVFPSFDRPLPMAVGEYTKGDTNIFWDVHDSSILGGLDTYSIFENIKSALEKKGYFGGVSIWAYVDEKSLPKEFITKFGRAGIQITFVPEGNRYSRVHAMLMHILVCALNHVNSPSSLLVLSRNMDGDMLFNTICEKAFKGQVMRFLNLGLAPLESLLLGGISICEKSIIPLPNQILIVITGTSGVNNEAVINRLLHVRQGLHFAPTTTTNVHMTPGEDYLLVQEYEFLKMVEKDELLICSKDKGISKKEIRDFVAKGEDVVLRMDNIDEALKLRETLGTSAVFILLVGESDISIESQDFPMAEERLLSLAKKQFRYLGFDYVVVNVKVDDAANRVKSIINAQKRKVRPRNVRI